MDKGIFDRQGNKLGELRKIRPAGEGIGAVLSVILVLILILGVVFVWVALVQEGSFLSLIMLGAQIVSAVIAGTVCVEIEKQTFRGIFVVMCPSITIASGILTWICSGGGNIFGFLLIAFFASILNSLISTVVVMFFQKKAHKQRMKEAERAEEQGKIYKQISKDWTCRCGALNSSNYASCKKCGEYRNSIVDQKAEADRVRKMILEHNESDTWMCTCGAKTNIKYGQCKKCGKFRGNIVI